MKLMARSGLVVASVLLVLFMVAGCRDHTAAPIPASSRYEFQVAPNGIIWRVDRQTGGAAYAFPGGQNIWHKIEALDSFPEAQVFLDATNTIQTTGTQP